MDIGGYKELELGSEFEIRQAQIQSTGCRHISEHDHFNDTPGAQAGSAKHVTVESQLFVAPGLCKHIFKVVQLAYALTDFAG
ncbi:hypothetical protein J6590_076136 [Homalodisca vitripennis]|nr:hypothetical protein J6590_076136 [Homalodisca vitripennis]